MRREEAGRTLDKIIAGPLLIAFTSSLIFKILLGDWNYSVLSINEMRKKGGSERLSNLLEATQLLILGLSRYKRPGRGKAGM